MSYRVIGKLAESCERDKQDRTLLKDDYLADPEGKNIDRLPSIVTVQHGTLYDCIGCFADELGLFIDYLNSEPGLADAETIEKLCKACKYLGGISIGFRKEPIDSTGAQYMTCQPDQCVVTLE